MVCCLSVVAPWRWSLQWDHGDSTSCQMAAVNLGPQDVCVNQVEVGVGDSWENICRAEEFCFLSEFEASDGLLLECRGAMEMVIAVGPW